MRVCVVLMYTLCILTVAPMKVESKGENSLQDEEKRGEVWRAKVQNKSEQESGGSKKIGKTERAEVVTGSEDVAIESSLDNFSK